jgi:hypothetical protein
MFEQWMNRHEPPRHLYSPAEYSDDPWRSHAVKAWFLAQALRAESFGAYALSEFIQNFVLAELDVWELIEAKSDPHSPLRRFSDHWVAWNIEISAPVTSEYSNLQAAKKVRPTTRGRRDPRVFDQEHWYSPCGEDLQQVVPEWGRDLETGNNYSVSQHPPISRTQPNSYRTPPSTVSTLIQSSSYQQPTFTAEPEIISLIIFAVSLDYLLTTCHPS